MSPFSQVGLLLVNTIGSLVLLIFLLRFLLQLVRADFYNPISQFVVRFSNIVTVVFGRSPPFVVFFKVKLKWNNENQPTH